MSKRQLISFIKELDREELEAQLIDLYERFKNVKEFYDFSFSPNENKRYQEAKYKIAKEYFPENGRKAKKRRSIAQNLFKHLLKLEFNPQLLADLMLFNIEIAQTYTKDQTIKQAAFCKSMLKSYRHALVYISEHGLEIDFKNRVEAIVETAAEQKWENAEGFGLALKELV
ncbi:MAG: DUF6155 family protein [Vicingaceae bacterium]